MTDSRLHPRSVVTRTTSGEMQPILPGFHPDPTICRVGDDFFLATSSFEYFPGVPIFRSADLVSWRQIGNVFDRRSQFRRGEAGPSSGIYAPTLRHHDGRFWLIATNTSEFDDGQIIVQATDPAGPWSEPVFVREAIGIDPDLAWGDDGTCYLTWHDLDFVRGGAGILQAPLDPETGELLTVPYPIWQGTGMVAAEGPHLHHIGDWWYIVLAEGGTERGHAVTIARAPRPEGPYEACPHNPVLTRRSSGHLVQNTGHADLVDTPDGGWAAVYLGVRATGSTPKFHVLGRETFVAGIDWVDGWPQIDTAAFDVPVPDTSFHDDFTGDDLDTRWVVPGGEPADVAVLDAEGGLNLRPASGAVLPKLCCRVRDLRWSAFMEVEGTAGLCLRIDDRHWYGMESDGMTVRARAQIGDVQQVLGEVRAGGDNVTLRIEAVDPPVPGTPGASSGPDEIVLSVDTGGSRIELARLDGRYLSTEVAAGFTGRMLGIVPGTVPGRVHSFAYTARYSQGAQL